MGFTPFQEAVSVRAYEAAFTLLKLSLCLAAKSSAAYSEFVLTPPDVLGSQTPSCRTRDPLDDPDLCPAGNAAEAHSKSAMESTTAADAASDADDDVHGCLAGDEVEMGEEEDDEEDYEDDDEVEAEALGFGIHLDGGSPSLGTSDSDVSVGSAERLDDNLPSAEDAVDFQLSSAPDAAAAPGAVSHGSSAAADLFRVDAAAAEQDLMAINEGLGVRADQPVAESSANAGAGSGSQSTEAGNNGASVMSAPGASSSQSTQSSQGEAGNGESSASVSGNSKPTQDHSSDSSAAAGTAESSKVPSSSQKDANAPGTSTDKPANSSSTAKKESKRNSSSSPCYSCRAEHNQEILIKLLCGNNSPPQDNPVFMLVQNNQCSYGWTGPSHICQVKLRV